MKPVFMTVSHNPPESYGDCFRCAIASILECQAEDIPHPFEYGENRHEQYRKMMEFLKEEFKVFIYFVAIRGEDLESFTKDLEGYALLGGMGTGDYHIVVINKYGIVHDPNPEGAGIEPMDSGTYHLGLICTGVL
jgi:hypothetical protein